MAENTSIEWATHTFNAWSGCTKVSPGCAHCYAESLSKRNPATLGVWGKGQSRRRMSEAYWRQPLKWNNGPMSGTCDKCGGAWLTPGLARDPHAEFYCADCGGTIKVHRPRVFCASLADWLDDEVPIEWLADLLLLIHRTPNLDWLLLSKRPQNFALRVFGLIDCFLTLGATGAFSHSGTVFADWLADWARGNPPANVWIGTTVEDQTRADERIPILLSIPAKVRFLSCEPLLGPVEFSDVTRRADAVAVLGRNALDGIHWVICGGESGPGARPIHPAWARSLRNQCAAAGVPFFFKQWGGWAPFSERFDRQLEPESVQYAQPDGTIQPIGKGHKPSDSLLYRVGKKAAGRLLDGREHNEFPAATQPQPAVA